MRPKILPRTELPRLDHGAAPSKPSKPGFEGFEGRDQCHWCKIRVLSMWPSQPGQAAQPPRARDRDCGPACQIAWKCEWRTQSRSRPASSMLLLRARWPRASLNCSAGSVLLDARLDPILLTTVVAPTPDTITQTGADGLCAAPRAGRRLHRHRATLQLGKRRKISVGNAVSD